ncbi:autotransporter assembly complex protein TamA [Profundibacterium mesophilum]|nr:autotransporter assembly complex family protein [Profundibacterium mesophilum]
MFICAAGAVAAQTVTFETPGADGDLAETLRESSLLVAAEGEDVTNAQELLAAARADYGRLVGALYSEGHFGGIVSILVNGREAAEIPPLAPLGAVERIAVTVRPGPVYTFGRAEVAPLAQQTELPEGFAAGQPARTPAIEDAGQAALTGWREEGHAKAAAAGQDITARHAQNQLDAAIAIAPGPRVTFGDLILRGGDSVRPARLRKIAGLPSGEIFSPSELERSAQRLRRTGVFSAVALTEAETLERDGSLDIIATLTEQKPRRFGFGAEISSVEGVTLSSFWLHRNLLGGAERLRVEGEVSGIGGKTGGMDYSFATRYSRPATLTPDTDLYVLAELARLEEPDYTSRIGSVGFGFKHIFSEELEAELGVAYRFSRVTDARGETDYSMLTFPGEVTYDTREKPLDAAQGVYLKADLTPFAGFGETGSGARLTFDTRSYVGFGDEDRIVLAGRVQGGSIIGAELTSVPNDYRFYSGGGGSVRGQDYQSLDVTLPDGTSSGGASFVGLSGELRGRVTDKIGVVAFADYGYVGDETFGGNGDSHAGAGLGLRYLTPIGPIRLDVAAPVSGGGSGFDVYVGIGQAF